MTEYGIWNVEYGIMQKNPPNGGFFNDTILPSTFDILS